MVTGLPARRDPCDDTPYGSRQATLVDFRGSNLSDASSNLAISTCEMSSMMCWTFRFNGSPCTVNGHRKPRGREELKDSYAPAGSKTLTVFQINTAVSDRLRATHPSGTLDLLTTISVADIVTNMDQANTTQPLTPAVFHILLALSSGERHGYGIMKQVEADSQGKVSMGPGTLYGSLKRMLDAGLVKESDKRVDLEMDDERRIYYQITGVGVKALEAELERYQRIVTIAQQRKLYPKA